MPTDVRGRARVAAEHKRTRQVYCFLSPTEHEALKQAAIREGIPVSTYLRDRILHAIIPRPSRDRVSKPGSSKWLWDRLREEVKFWVDSGMKNDFVPLGAREAYLREIQKNTSLNQGEADHVIRDFLRRNRDEIADYVHKHSKRYLLSTQGRILKKKAAITDDTEADDEAPAA
jgi:rRNA-processing protein FCF1